MHLRHDPATDASSPSLLATRIDVADTLLTQFRGLMFRRSLPDEYALVFRFDSTKTRDVHMLFVFTALDVVWLEDETVTRVERLRPFVGFARERCDAIVELPPGAADDVAVGDRLVLES